MRRHPTGKTLGRLLVGGYIVIYLIFVLFPILWLLLGSLKSRYESLLMPPRIIFEPTFLAYEKLLFGGLLHTFGNSITIALINVLLALVFGVPAAYALSRMRGSVRKNVSFWILSIRMAPAFGVVLPIFVFMRSLNLLDTITAVIIAHLTINLPLAIWLLLGYFDELPQDIEDAALIDGANHLQVLWRVLLPVSRPMLIAVALLVFVFSWNEFLFAFILTSSEAQTVPALIASLAGTMNFDWPLMSAISVSALLPAFLVVFFAQRHITEGLTLGAVR
ncbi:MAG: carbohydrate ABC transporter permease [Trueperaceae bacterium]|nr:MAG: carbohydrate ABC transporter permease [Trueperaceae bacterium]